MCCEYETKARFSHSVWMGGVHKFVELLQVCMPCVCVCVCVCLCVTEPEKEKEEGLVCLCATPHALIKKKTASAGHE